MTHISKLTSAVRVTPVAISAVAAKQVSENPFFVIIKLVHFLQHTAQLTSTRLGGFRVYWRMAFFGTGFRGQGVGLVLTGAEWLTCKTCDGHMQENEAERIKFPQDLFHE